MGIKNSEVLWYIIYEIGEQNLFPGLKNDDWNGVIEQLAPNQTVVIRQPKTRRAISSWKSAINQEEKNPISISGKYIGILKDIATTLNADYTKLFESGAHRIDYRQLIKGYLQKLEEEKQKRLQIDWVSSRTISSPTTKLLQKKVY